MRGISVSLFSFSPSGGGSFSLLSIRSSVYLFVCPSFRLCMKLSEKPNRQLKPLSAHAAAAAAAAAWRVDLQAN